MASLTRRTCMTCWPQWVSRDGSGWGLSGSRGGYNWSPQWDCLLHRESFRGGTGGTHPGEQLPVLSPLNRETEAQSSWATGSEPRQAHSRAGPPQAGLWLSCLVALQRKGWATEESWNCTDFPLYGWRTEAGGEARVPHFRSHPHEVLEPL